MKPRPQFPSEVTAVLNQDVPSESGREDYVPVTVSFLSGASYGNAGLW